MPVLDFSVGIGGGENVLGLEVLILGSPADVREWGFALIGNSACGILFLQVEDLDGSIIASFIRRYGTCCDVAILWIKLDGMHFDLGLSVGEEVLDVDGGIGDEFDSTLGNGYSCSLVMDGSSRFLSLISCNKLNNQYQRKIVPYAFQNNKSKLQYSIINVSLTFRQLSISTRSRDRFFGPEQICIIY